MQFKINDKIVFDTIHRTITHTETNENIRLSLSQALLLEYILKSNSEIMARDKIINELWDLHSITSSGHTLSQYISVLRRVFTQFGCDNLIITMLRAGLCLNPEVKIQMITAGTQSAVNK